VALFIGPWVLGALAFTIYPVSSSLYYSLTEYSLGMPPVWIGLANWSAMLHDPLFRTALTNTLYYTGCAVPLQIVTALAVALLLNTRIFGRGFFRTIVYLPTLVPSVANAILWLALFDPFGGLIDRMLGYLHLPQPLWLQSPVAAMPALILMSAWGTGGTVVILLAGLQDVPKQLYEQGMIDGAGAVRLFWHVTLPVISPIVLFNAITGIIGSMQTFTEPYLMTQGGPMNATLLYSLYLFQNAFQYLNMGYASALAWFLFVMIFMLTLLALWVSRRVVYYR
jgi:multiple sugar transport system permease protein